MPSMWEKTMQLAFLYQLLKNKLKTSTWNSYRALVKIFLNSENFYQKIMLASALELDASLCKFQDFGKLLHRS